MSGRRNNMYEGDDWRRDRTKKLISVPPDSVVLYEMTVRNRRKRKMLTANKQKGRKILRHA